MDSIGSSGRSAVLRTAARAAAEGALLAAAVAVGAGRLGGAGTIWGARVGIAAAWAASAASVSWLLWARGRSWRAFWWAFGGGMALRAGLLAGLAAWAWRREGVSMEALLLSYVFGLTAMMLTLELRHIRIR